MTESQLVICEGCNGEGLYASHQCNKCNGSGYRWIVENVIRLKVNFVLPEQLDQ